MKASEAVFLVFLIVLSLCLVNTQPVKAQSSGTIYIRADGSIEGTDKIQRNGNIYTLTGNISGGIQVQKSHVVLDGAGYTLQGNGDVSWRGIDLSNNRGSDPSRPEISNVTIKNMRIVNFDRGIENVNTNNNTIIGNYIADCFTGINIMGSPNNVLIKNNTIANNVNGISIAYSGGNQIITENNMINDVVSSNNVIIVWLSPQPTINRNYWSDYNGTDNNGDGIGDTPYVINEENQDNYPLMNEGGKFEPYLSTSHILFEDRSHKLLGNLSAELRTTEPEKEIIRSVCKLSLSSPRLDEYHEPYIHKVELITAWGFIIHGWGPVEIPQPPPYPEKVTLYADEEIILFDHSDNVSSFENEPRIVFGFSRGLKITPAPWGAQILPTIRVYFSDGQEWEWEYEYNVTLPFMLWSGIEVNLSELSGKIETETITFTTVKKGYPIIITSVRVTILASIIVAIAVAAVFVKYRKKQ